MSNSNYYLWFFVIVNIICYNNIVSAQNVDSSTSNCYTGGSIAGAVFGTLIVLLLLEAAAYVLWRLYWNGKSGQHLVLISDPEKGESMFAFDNPGFKEGPSILQQPAEKENHSKLKWPQWNSMGLIPSNNTKVKAMDDTYTAHPPLTIVPLRSHDFTGLGFNICGNMRDGIYVKDVLHRGPASESGRIMPGDRIDSIKVSLRHMVFEDALTILSYASPYEVELSIQSRGCGNGSTLLRTPPPPHKISHPFYRSHSISDLKQIGKSNSRRMNEQPSSLLSDVGSDSLKPSTLDRKSKIQIEPEKNQNQKNFHIENVQKQENIFHEIELDNNKDEVDKSGNNSNKDTSNTSTSSSPSNVKSILVKGIQNLKEKLHNSLQHQDESNKEESKSTVVNIVSSNDFEMKIDNDETVDDGFKTAELKVPEEVERAGVSAKNNRKSLMINDEDSIVQDNQMLNDSEDPVAAKRNKRKAPKPPPVPDINEQLDDEEQHTALNQSEMMNHHNSLESVDSDSENGDRSGTTIELNSSHITVHHAPTSQDTAESRKASSLGDLSRYDTENSVALLERAVSLDLGDGCPGGTCSKKRKAPIPPQEDLTPYKEARLDCTLKKSSIWGTLEDVIQNGDTAGGNGSSDSETDLGISGCSTPEKSEMITTSTPYKFDPETLLNLHNATSNGISNIEVSACNWELNVVEPPSNEETTSSDFVTALNGGGDDTPPELPTSPMPTLSSFITEIQVTSIKSPGSPEVIHLDSTQQLLDHMNTHHLNRDTDTTADDSNDDDDDDEECTTPTASPEPSHQQSSTIIPPATTATTITETIRQNTTNVGGQNNINNYYKENMPGEQILTMKATPSLPPNVQPRTTSTITTTTTSMGNVVLDGGGIIKPARTNVTVTNIKNNNVTTHPSRIPVRAGHRSPGSSLSPASDKRSVIHRNGHSTP